MNKDKILCDLLGIMNWIETKIIDEYNKFRLKTGLTISYEEFKKCVVRTNGNITDT